jgi:hypothetical protein
MQKLEASGLKLKPSKCSIAKRSTAYLGHIISEHGVGTDPAKVEAVVGIQQPKTVKQMRSFLGLSGYYRRYVVNFSTIAAPLYAILEKDRPFQWTEKCQAAFIELKERLTTAPIFGLPRLRKTIPNLHRCIKLRVGHSALTDGREERKGDSVCQ